MGSPDRRDFLVNVTALAGAAGLFAATERASGGDASFMNNVPDPLLAQDALPEFTFALEKSQGRVLAGSYGKEATVEQLPISKGIAGVSMRLEPGVMRELHWHATAAEWAYVVSGRVRTTVVDPQGRTGIDDFGPGDVWYFPRGHGHMLQCLGNEPCHFILVFDNGYFSEFGTFSLTDWIGHVPPRCSPRTSAFQRRRSRGFPRRRSTSRRVRCRRSRRRRRWQASTRPPCHTSIRCTRRSRTRPSRGAASGESRRKIFRSRRR